MAYSKLIIYHVIGKIHRSSIDWILLHGLPLVLAWSPRCGFGLTLRPGTCQPVRPAQPGPGHPAGGSRSSPSLPRVRGLRHPRRGQPACTGAGFEGFRSQQAVAPTASAFGFGWMTPEPRHQFYSLAPNQRRRAPGAPGVPRRSCRLELASPSSSPQSHLKLPPALPKN